MVAHLLHLLLRKAVEEAWEEGDQKEV